jgi:hypothetical protein
MVEDLPLVTDTTPSSSQQQRAKQSERSRAVNWRLQAREVESGTKQAEENVAAQLDNARAAGRSANDFRLSLQAEREAEDMSQDKMFEPLVTEEDLDESKRMTVAQFDAKIA